MNLREFIADAAEEIRKERIKVLAAKAEKMKLAHTVTDDGLNFGTKGFLAEYGTAFIQPNPFAERVVE